MIRQRPEGPSSTSPKASSQGQLARRNPREPITILVTYRGGAEGWWEIKARGRVWRVPGVLALHDVLMGINEGKGGRKE